MENRVLHDRMMQILHQRAANGEGEYGGFAKGQPLTYEQYLAVWKGRHGSSRGALAAYRRLHSNKSKAKKTTKKTTKKRKPYTRRGVNSDIILPILKGPTGNWAKFRKENAGKGLSIHQLSDMYHASLGYQGPLREGVSYHNYPEAKSIDVLEDALDVLDTYKLEGENTEDIKDASNALFKVITTRNEDLVRQNGQPLTQGQHKLIAQFQRQRDTDKDPARRKLFDANIQNILASGEGGEDYESYYNMY
jgi:hypothetical protein